MFDVEAQKKIFANYVASFTDLGNIKILDFKATDCLGQRIRFLFEEDYFRLHISGDWGNLIAENTPNMCFWKFYRVFSRNPWAFEDKVRCCERPIYCYDWGQAKRMIAHELRMEDGWESYDGYDPALFLEKIHNNFDCENGLNSYAVGMIMREASEMNDDAVYRLGRKPTGILETYLLAFRLAYDQLAQRGIVRK